MKVETHQQRSTLTVGLSGEWESGHPPPRFEGFFEEKTAGHPVRAIDFHTTDLGAWDRSLHTLSIGRRRTQ